MPKRSKRAEDDSDSSRTSSRDSSGSDSPEKHRASRDKSDRTSSKHHSDSPKRERSGKGDRRSTASQQRTSKHMREDQGSESKGGSQRSRDRDRSIERGQGRRDRGREERDRSNERSYSRRSTSKDRGGRESRGSDPKDKGGKESRGSDPKQHKSPESYHSIDRNPRERGEKTSHVIEESKSAKNARNKQLSDVGKGSQSESKILSSNSKSNLPSREISKEKKKAEQKSSSSNSEESSDSETSGSEDASQVRGRTQTKNSDARKSSSNRTIEMRSAGASKSPGHRAQKPPRSSPEDSDTDSSGAEENQGVKKLSPAGDGDRSKFKSPVKESETKIGSKRKVISREGTDEQEKHGSTPEKDRNVEIKEEGEVEEEKEEGEISEDEDDAAHVKPLIAISEDMSDISSEDETQPQPPSTVPKPKITSPKSPHTPATSDDDSTRQNRNIVSSQDRSPPRKVERTVVVKETPPHKKADDTCLDHSNLKRETKERGNSDSFVDKEVSEGEDNSKRERPILESESEEEEEERKTGLRSHVEPKSKMGSSVSVVRPRDGRTRDGEGDRESSRRRNDDRRSDRNNRRRDRDWGTDKKHDEDRDRRRYDDDRDRRREDQSRRRGDLGERNAAAENTKKRVDGSGPGDSGQGVNKDTIRSGKASESEVSAGAKKPAGDITTKTGGAYIPPAKLRMMQEQITDKTSVAYQRMSWEALKKSINGLINKVNVSNIINIIKELFQENIVRGRGLLARSVIQAQAASPTFTHVYAALVAIINTKFPQNGELILRRLILMFRRGYRRNDKALCLSSTRFIAHLVNQQVAHEVLALEILTLLLENPTDDSVEVAIGFLKECGQKLTEVSPRGIGSIFERLRNILHEGVLDVRVDYMVEVMFAVRKDGFQNHPAVLSDLDLVEEEEQFTHLLQLEDAVNGDEILNIFKEDKNFAESEEKYKALKKEILDDESSEEESEGGSSGSESSESDEEAEERENAEKQKILDQTETNLVALRRTIYLTIQSSLDHNECAHKMLKMELKPGQEVELCNMILDCCAQLRTYEKFFGLLAQRFCQIDKKYIEPFQQIFVEQFETCHRLETNKLRNVAKFFSHMLHTDAISWGVLSVVKLTEEDTTSASRIFLKTLFQELSEFMGLLKLNQRLKDLSLAPFFEGILPRDNPKNTRFAINFFTTIGLGGLTDDLREHLKDVTKKIVQEKQDQAQAELARGRSSSSSSGSDSSSSSSDDSDSSDSESSDSEPDAASRKKKKSGSSSTARNKKTKSSSNKKDGTDRKRGRDDAKKSQVGHRDSDRKASRDQADKETRKSRSEKTVKESGSSSRGKHALNGKGRGPSPEKGMSIAARLLSMAQYGDLVQAAEEPAPDSRSNGKDRSKQRKDGASERKGDVERAAAKGTHRRARSSDVDEKDRAAENNRGMREGSGRRRDRETVRGDRREDESEQVRRKEDGRPDKASRGRNSSRDDRGGDARGRQTNSHSISRRGEGGSRQRDLSIERSGRNDEDSRGKARRNKDEAKGSTYGNRHSKDEAKRRDGKNSLEDKRRRKHATSSETESSGGDSSDSDSSGIVGGNDRARRGALELTKAESKKRTSLPAPPADRKRRGSSPRETLKKRPRHDSSSSASSSSQSSSSNEESGPRGGGVMAARGADPGYAQTKRHGRNRDESGHLDNHKARQTDDYKGRRVGSQDSDKYKSRKSESNLRKTTPPYSSSSRQTKSKQQQPADPQSVKKRKRSTSVSDSESESDSSEASSNSSSSEDGGKTQRKSDRKPEREKVKEIKVNDERRRKDVRNGSASSDRRRVEDLEKNREGKRRR